MATSQEQFLERLKLCAKKVGSAYALSRKAGLTPSTMMRYFRGSNPTRENLVAIADAAGVDVGWLASGRGTQNAHLEETNEPQMRGDPLALVQRRLVALVATSDIMRISADFEVDWQVIQSFLNPPPEARDALREFCLRPEFPLRRLLMDSDFATADMTHWDLPGRAMLVVTQDIDFQRLDRAGVAFRNSRPRLDQWIKFYDRCRRTLMSAIPLIYNRLPAAIYAMFRVSAAYSTPDFPAGSLLLVDQSRTEIASDGWFVFDMRPAGAIAPEERHLVDPTAVQETIPINETSVMKTALVFVRKVVRTPEGPCVETNGRLERFPIQNHYCWGTLVAVLAFPSAEMYRDPLGDEFARTQVSLVQAS
jgi:transcriptional regulator with XRE-family HTH domain